MIAFTSWHLDAVSGSHPTHLLSKIGDGDLNGNEWGDSGSADFPAETGRAVFGAEGGRSMAAIGSRGWICEGLLLSDGANVLP
jgi:hypothetical protein